MTNAARVHFNTTVQEADPLVADALASERARQQNQIELIASENIVSRAVLDALGHEITNKTLEGYPGNRFHGGGQFVDIAEQAAIDRAKQLFNCGYANVQPHSGTQANQAVYLALLEPGDTILSMSLSAGGHLSHAANGNLVALSFRSVHYGVSAATGLIDYDDVERMARAHRPRLIICGASAYPRAIDFPRLGEIAKSVGAFLMADIAHVAGLVGQGLFPNPFPHADVVTSTTYKNLRSVRGGIILSSDAEIARRIDQAVCPGLQGVPSVGSIAAKAIGLGEARTPWFRAYAERVLDLSHGLAEAFLEKGVPVQTGGTDTPLVVLKFEPRGEAMLDFVRVLDRCGIGANVVPLPGDTGGFEGATGLRLGTSALATRGFEVGDCPTVAALMLDIFEYMPRQRRATPDSAIERGFRSRVSALCKAHPIPYGPVETYIKPKRGTTKC